MGDRDQEGLWRPGRQRGEGFQAALCVKGSEGEERKLLEDVEEEQCDWCSE